MLTQSLVKSLFDYEADGFLIWKYDATQSYRWNCRHVGTVAGSKRHTHVAISIGGVKYYAHRLIWLWHFGYLPEYIDHIDGNSLNNRIENLRECNMSQNQANASIGNMRGIEAHGAKWRARINVNGVRIELGSYETQAAAQDAYRDAAKRFFGEYAEVNRG